MLKCLGAFLLLFWLLSLVVHASGLGYLFLGIGSILIATDFLFAGRGASSSSVRRELIQ
jgi:hypothetical protein